MNVPLVRIGRKAFGQYADRTAGLAERTNRIQVTGPEPSDDRLGKHGESLKNAHRFYRTFSSSARIPPDAKENPFCGGTRIKAGQRPAGSTAGAMSCQGLRNL